MKILSILALVLFVATPSFADDHAAHADKKQPKPAKVKKEEKPAAAADAAAAAPTGEAKKEEKKH